MDAEEMRILQSGSARSNYEYALNNPNCDVRAHGKVVIDSGDAWDNYIFAIDIRNADVKAHGQVVINKGDVYTNYLFARDVKGADIKAHEKVIIDSNSLYCNYLFAKDVPGANVMAHRKVIEKLGNEEQLDKFDRKVKWSKNNLDYGKEENTYKKKDFNKRKNKISNPYQFDYKELNNDELLNDLVQANVSVFLHGPSGVGK